MIGGKAGTTERWFGPGKKSAIWSIAILAIVALGIIVGIIAAMNARGETNVGQSNAPVAPTALTPVSSVPIAPTKPAQMPTATTAGVVVITVEELLNQIIQNPNRYKEGTVIQITGVALRYEVGTSVWSLYLGPRTQGFHVDVDYEPGAMGGELSTYLIKRFSVSNESFPITVRGTLRWVRETQVLIEHAILVP